MKALGSRIPDKLFALTIKPILANLTHVSTDLPVAALTFDDGPHPVFTPVLLDVLRKHGAKATFFMLGTAARTYPDIVRSVAQDGHAIGNHSWSHPSLPGLRAGDVFREIRAGAQATAPFGRKLFRPPFGRQNRSSRAALFLLGYTSIHWNMDVLDWQTGSSEQIRAKLMTDIRPGSIILLHDAMITPREEGLLNRYPMIQALDAFLEQTGKTYRFVTVPELLRRGTPQKQHWTWRAGRGLSGEHR